MLTVLITLRTCTVSVNWELPQLSHFVNSLLTVTVLAVIT